MHKCTENKKKVQLFFPLACFITLGVRSNCRIASSRIALFSNCSEFAKCLLYNKVFFYHLKSIVALKLYAYAQICCSAHVFHAYIQLSSSMVSRDVRSLNEMQKKREEHVSFFIVLQLKFFECSRFVWTRFVCLRLKCVNVTVCR